MADRDPLPPLPRIHINQMEIYIREQRPSIHAAVAGLEKKKFPTGTHQHRLSPMLCIPWHTVNADVDNIWKQLLANFGRDPILDRPPNQNWMPHVTSEASARHWIDNCTIRHSINILALRDRIQAGNIEGLNPNLVQAFQNVGRIWDQNERKTDFRPALADDLDIPAIAADIRTNANFHRVYGSSNG